MVPGIDGGQQLLQMFVIIKILDMRPIIKVRKLNPILVRFRIFKIINIGTVYVNTVCTVRQRAHLFF